MATIAETLLARTARDGGCTVSLVSGDVATHTDGFYVGGVVPTVKLALSPTEADYAGAVESVRAAMGGRGHIGTWINLEDGTVDVDGVDWVPDADTALELGRARGELAVWEIAGGTELFC